jgi:hypothetical protein
VTVVVSCLSDAHGPQIKEFLDPVKLSKLDKSKYQGSRFVGFLKKEKTHG